MPSGKDLVRTEPTERVDQPDFEHITRAVLDYHQSIAGSVITENAIVSAGWDLSIIGTSQIKIERNDGVLIGPEIGSTDSVHGVDLGGRRIIKKFCGSDQIVDFAGKSVGNYHLYVYQSFVPSKYAKRIKFVSGVEVPDSFNTRFEPAYYAQILPVTTSPGDDRVRIATVEWDGVQLLTSHIHLTMQLLFEGMAVPNGSAEEFLAEGFTGATPLEDFSRDPDRVANGSQDLGEFCNAVLKSIEEVKSKVFPEWYKEIPHSLDSVGSATYTIGQGTAGSVGDFNATEVSSSGTYTYYRIDVALTQCIAQCVSDGVKHAHIHFKPGIYSLDSDVPIPRDGAQFSWTLSGASMESTFIRFKASLVLDHDGSASLASHVEFRDFEISSQIGSTAMIQFAGPATSYESRFSFKRINGQALTLANVVWGPKFPVVQLGAQTKWYFDEVNTRGKYDLASATTVDIRDSTLGHVDVGNIVAPIGDTPYVRVTDSNMQSLTVMSGDEFRFVEIDGCGFSNIEIRDCTNVIISGCNSDEFICSNSSGTRSYRIWIEDVDTTVISDCTIHNASTPSVYGVAVGALTTGQTALVQNCKFPASVTPTPNGLACVWANNVITSNVIVKDCHAESWGESIYKGPMVDGGSIYHHKTGLTNTNFIEGVGTNVGRPSVKNLEIIAESSLLDVDWMFRDVDKVEGCKITVPRSNEGNYQIGWSGVGPTFQIDIADTDFILNDAEVFDIRPPTPAVAPKRPVVRMRDVTISGGVTIAQFLVASSGSKVHLESVKVDGAIAIFDLLTSSDVDGGIIVTMKDVDCTFCNINASVDIVEIDGCVFEGTDLTSAVGLAITRVAVNAAPAIGVGGHCTVKNCTFLQGLPWFASGAKNPELLSNSASARQGPAIQIGSDDPGESGEKSFYTVKVEECTIHCLVQDTTTPFPAIIILSEYWVELFDNFIDLNLESSSTGMPLCYLVAASHRIKGNTFDIEGISGSPYVLQVGLLGLYSSSPASLNAEAIAEVDDNSFMIRNTQLGLTLVQHFANASSVSGVIMESFQNNKLMTGTTGAGVTVWAEAGSSSPSKLGLAHGNIFFDRNANLAVVAGVLPGIPGAWTNTDNR
jgi:hypothetical protein